jgi:hypothetical protein
MTDEKGDDVDTYRSNLLKYLVYEQQELEKEKARVDARLLEVRNHIAALTKAKTQNGDLKIERFGRPKRR